MDERIKGLWIEALESGEYAQTREGLLHRSIKDSQDSFCCLGVLCDLAEKEGIVERDFITTTARYTSVNDSTDRTSGALPIAVMEWAGIGTSMGSFTSSEAISG